MASEQTKRTSIIDVLLGKLEGFNFSVELFNSEAGSGTKSVAGVKTYNGEDLDSKKPAIIDAETPEARANFIWGDGNRIYLSDSESIPYNSIFQVSFILPKHKGVESIEIAEEFAELIKLGYINDEIKDVTVFDKSIYGYMLDDDTGKAITVASFTIKAI